jgi:hypothetical protein
LSDTAVAGHATDQPGIHHTCGGKALLPN